MNEFKKMLQEYVIACREVSVAAATSRRFVPIDSHEYMRWRRAIEAASDFGVLDELEELAGDAAAHGRLYDVREE